MVTEELNTYLHEKSRRDIGVSLLECVNPRKNKWRVRWDIQAKENNENIVTFMEEEFDHCPTDEEIKSLVIGWYNEQIDNAILMGMTYNGVQVWLSQENSVQLQGCL